MTSTIYALTEPGTLTIRYIGKAIHSLPHRLGRHLREARSGRHDYYKDRWLRKLLSEGLEPGALVLEVCDGDGCGRNVFTSH